MSDVPALRYSTRQTITVEQFADLLRRSTLAERRPVDEPTRLQSMLTHANLLCTAWAGDQLVGVARSLTDFDYCCYLSDLAVDERHQRQGIGRELIRLTQTCLAPQARLILLAAPKAESYYPGLGFAPHRSAWTLSANQTLT